MTICLHTHLCHTGMGIGYELDTHILVYLRQGLSQSCHLCAVAFIVILLRNHLLQLLFLYSYAIKCRLQKGVNWVGRKVKNKDQMGLERMSKIINFFAF